jgi:hypothetical protein
MEFGDSRPLLWWMQSPYLWKPHWQVCDIPEAHRANFRRRVDAKRAAGVKGWAVADFAGLARKQGTR